MITPTEANQQLAEALAEYQADLSAKCAEVQAMIAGVLEAFPVSQLNDGPQRRQRIAALKAVQWRFRGPNGEFVGLGSFFACAFVPESEALIFDGRDNETIKLQFYEMSLGPLSIEVLPQITKEGQQ